MYIPILLGTSREGRLTEKVSDFLNEIGQESGLKTEVVDVRDFQQEAAYKHGSEQAKKWAEIIKKADGLVIVSPEYNHSYPGELKSMLDMLLKEYIGLKVGFATVSGGPFGGVRLEDELRKLVSVFQMHPISKVLYFSGISEGIDEKQTERAKEFFTAFKS